MEWPGADPPVSRCDFHFTEGLNSWFDADFWLRPEVVLCNTAGVLDDYKSASGKAPREIEILRSTMWPRWSHAALFDSNKEKKQGIIINMFHCFCVFRRRRRSRLYLVQVCLSRIGLKQLALDCAEAGIQVFGIAPGPSNRHDRSGFWTRWITTG